MPIFLDILHLVCKVKEGFSEGVYLTPPAATWSRLRSSTTPGQLPLRSRSEPLRLSSQQIEKKRQSNRQMEAVVWIVARHIAGFVASERFSSFQRISEGMSEIAVVVS